MAAHLYYRLYVTSSNGSVNCWVTALELRDAVGGTNLALTGSGTASSSAPMVWFEAANGFDGLNTTLAMIAQTTFPGWLKWQFSTAQDVLEVALVQSSVDSPSRTAFPKNAEVQYSDDGINWILHTQIVNNPDAYGTYTYLPYVVPLATVALSAPVPTLVSAGGSYAVLTAPLPTLTFTGGTSVALTAPTPTLWSTASPSYNNVRATAPAPALESRGGGYAALTAPAPTLSSTATGVIWGTTDVSVPSPTLSAYGVVPERANVALTAPSPNARAYSGAVVSITIGAPTVVTTGTAGAVGHAAVTVPMFQLSASGTEQNHGGANLVVPMPRMAASIQAYMTAPMATLTAIGTATITATYEAYALNLNHNSDASDEMTRYTNFPFTHVVRYKNSYYGANSTGLYLLEGTTDDGVAIDWSFKTGMTDFDSPQNKTVTYAYFGGRLGPAATVSIYPSEPAGTSYAYTTPRGQTAQNYRQQFGKGLKARYFAIGAAGSDTLELDSIDLSVVTLKRRI